MNNYFLCMTFSNLTIKDGIVIKDRTGEIGRKATELDFEKADLIIEKGVQVKNTIKLTQEKRMHNTRGLDFIIGNLVGLSLDERFDHEMFCANGGRWYDYKPKKK